MRPKIQRDLWVHVFAFQFIPISHKNLEGTGRLKLKDQMLSNPILYEIVGTPTVNEYSHGLILDPTHDPKSLRNRVTHQGMDTDLGWINGFGIVEFIILEPRNIKISSYRFGTHDENVKFRFAAMAWSILLITVIAQVLITAGL
jgi:hypothetical protein